MCVCVCGTGQWRGCGDKNYVHGLTGRQSQVFANTRHPYTSPDLPHVAFTPSWCPASPHVTSGAANQRPRRTPRYPWQPALAEYAWSSVSSQMKSSHMLLTVGGRGCDLINIWKHTLEDYWLSITERTPPPILFISRGVWTWLHLPPQINARAGKSSNKEVGLMKNSSHYCCFFFPSFFFPPSLAACVIPPTANSPIVWDIYEVFTLW